GVAITPDGGRIYVTNLGSDSVSVIETATNTVAATVPVGASPAGVAITPDGGHAYVINQSSDSVSVIEIEQSATLTGLPAAGVVGQPYRHAFTVTGRPAPTVAVTAGALPDGMTLSTEGVLSGTPPPVVDSSSRSPPPTASAMLRCCRSFSTSPTPRPRRGPSDRWAVTH
ncbi:beta-propeller fold lactonase family protein, partial [Rhodococcus erythropolis]|nr:beta-propeller fold lactonase family protein [Rhodococcus erythropolis]